VNQETSGGEHPEIKTFSTLGDSYTLGEAVIPGESFPFQLADKLSAGGVKVGPPHVIAITGWTTINLLAALKEVPLEEKYDFLTVLTELAFII